MVTDQYYDIISRGNNKLLSSFILQKYKFSADIHPPLGWSRVPGLQQARGAPFAGGETSHKKQQGTGQILGSQIIMHIVVRLRDLCPLKPPYSRGEGLQERSS